MRIYAEDPANGFLPSTGVLKRLRPAHGPGIREDSGMREGDEISRYYDPMISKLIARAGDRNACIDRMLRALEIYEIAGVRTNIPYCRHILSSEQFRRAEFSTHSADHEFLDSYRQSLETALPDEALLAAAIAKSVHENHHVNNGNSTAAVAVASTSGWKRAGRKQALNG